MILGIDYGLKHLGLALSEGEFASPWKTVAVSGQRTAVSKIQQLAKDLTITTVVVGLSEGKSKERALGFGKKLQGVLRLPVEYIDETLSTQEASQLAKDKDDEHSKAAAIILQRWLDNKANWSN